MKSSNDGKTVAVRPNGSSSISGTQPRASHPRLGGLENPVQAAAFPDASQEALPRLLPSPPPQATILTVSSPLPTSLSSLLEATSLTPARDALTGCTVINISKRHKSNTKLLIFGANNMIILSETSDDSKPDASVHPPAGELDLEQLCVCIWYIIGIWYTKYENLEQLSVCLKESLPPVNSRQGQRRFT